MLLYLFVAVFLFSRCTQFSLCNGTMRHRWGWKTYRQSMIQGWLSDREKKRRVFPEFIQEGHLILEPWGFHWPCRSIGLIQTNGLLPPSCYTQHNWELLSWQRTLRHAACSKLWLSYQLTPRPRFIRALGN